MKGFVFINLKYFSRTDFRERKPEEQKQLGVGWGGGTGRDESGFANMRRAAPRPAPDRVGDFWSQL